MGLGGMDTDEEIDVLNGELDKLTKDISDARKHGKDTKMAEIMLIGLPHKIKYAEISGEAKDISRAKALLARVRQELEQAAER